MKIGYVVKRYPRFSETFIVNEILAHEAVDWELEIFSLRAPVDTHFQDRLARVRAPVNYLPAEGIKGSEFWTAVAEAAEVLPGVCGRLEATREEEALEVYQALLLARATRLRGIAHLHAHFATSATGVARLAAHFAGISYSFTAHAKDIFHDSVRPDDLRRKLSAAAAVVTVSDYNVAHLRSVFGTAAARVSRVYNGLDLEDFPYASPHDRPPRIVAVGRLVEKKGFGNLIEACARLFEEDQRFECQIVGAGELEQELRALIKRSDLEQTVHLMGPRPQPEVIRLVQGAAVLAAPCVVGGDGNRDGLPTVLLEAMALGTPCISTDVTGIPEVVRHDETGVLVPQHDAPALAAALRQLLTDPERRCLLASRARQLVEAEFNVHRNAACLRSLFQAGCIPERERVAPVLQEAG
jgi:glycosyltransferase involved in cell wall biosynthesis